MWKRIPFPMVRWMLPLRRNRRGNRLIGMGVRLKAAMGWLIGG